MPIDESARSDSHARVVLDADPDAAVAALRARMKEARESELWLETRLPRWIAETPWDDDLVARATSIAANLEDAAETPIERTEAEAQAAAFLAKNLAYGSHRYMTDALAAELAAAFVALFPDGTRFISNHEGSSWSPATNATFDWAIWAVHETRVGVLVVSDED